MLNVANIIKSASMMLSVEELKDFPNVEENEMTNKLQELMLYCVNEVIADLSCNYFPQVIEEEVEMKNNSIYYEDFKKPIVRIYAVKDNEEKTLSFQKFSDHLRVYSNLEKVIIRYSIMPKKIIDLTAEISDVNVEITEQMMALGVATEFCLCRGKLTQATIFDQKFKDAIEFAKMPKKYMHLKKRKWF